MLKMFISAAAAMLLSGAAAAHDRVVIVPDLVYVGGPVPQGHPFLVNDDGVVVVYPVPRTPLRYGLINDRRVLIDPVTMRVVYYLHP